MEILVFVGGWQKYTKLKSANFPYAKCIEFSIHLIVVQCEEDEKSLYLLNTYHS